MTIIQVISQFIIFSVFIGFFIMFLKALFGMCGKNFYICDIFKYLKNLFKYGLKPYTYIISHIYLDSNKVVLECYVRYNKILKQFEFYVQTSRENWSWHNSFDYSVTCNLPPYLNLYGDAFYSKFDLQEYDNKIFIDKNLVKKYITLNQQSKQIIRNNSKFYISHYKNNNKNLNPRAFYHEVR